MTNRRDFLLKLGIGAIVLPITVKAATEESFEVQMNQLLLKIQANFDSKSPEQQAEYIRFIGSKELEDELARRYNQPQIDDCVKGWLKDLQDYFKDRFENGGIQ